MGVEIKFKTFPDGELRSIDVAKIDEVLQTGVADQAGLKLKGGEVVIVLHSPRDAVQMLRDADLPPLPQAEPEKVLEKYGEHIERHMQQVGPVTESQAEALKVAALVTALCEEFNRVLAEALQ